MPSLDFDLEIVTRVTRERVHGCLFAYQHAPTAGLKEKIAKRIGEEMHRTLDMMGISAPQAKQAFDACALAPPVKMSATAARDIAAVLHTYDAAAAELFEVAAKNLPKPRFAAKAYEADIAAYDKAIAYWDVLAQRVPEKSTWRAWDDCLMAVEAAAHAVCRIADAIRMHLDDMRADGIEHVGALAWEAEYAEVDLRPRDLFVECAERVASQTQTTLKSLEAELQQRVKAFTQQRDGEATSKRPNGRNTPPACTPVLTVVEQIVKLQADVPDRARKRQVFVAAEAAARMVKEAASKASSTRNLLQSQVMIPPGAEASFAASATEWVTRWRRPETGHSELLVHDMQKGVTSSLAVSAHGWSLRGRGGTLVVRSEHQQQFEVVRARNGTFVGQAVLRATHQVEDPLLFDAYDDRVAIGGSRGSIQLFRLHEDGLQSIGSFKAHNYRLSKMVLGNGFLVTMGVSGSEGPTRTTSVWSTSSTPSFRLVGKSSAKDKFDLEPGSSYVTAHGKFLYSIDGEDRLHMRRIAEEKLDRTFHTSIQLGGQGRVGALGVSDGLLAVATPELVQVFDSKTLEETARVDLPGVIASLVVPGPGQVHVAVDNNQPLKTFATRGLGRR